MKKNNKFIQRFIGAVLFVIFCVIVVYFVSGYAILTNETRSPSLIIFYSVVVLSCLPNMFYALNFILNLIFDNLPIKNEK